MYKLPLLLLAGRSLRWFKETFDQRRECLGPTQSDQLVQEGIDRGFNIQLEAPNIYMSRERHTLPSINQELLPATMHYWGSDIDPNVSKP